MLTRADARPDAAQAVRGREPADPRGAAAQGARSRRGARRPRTGGSARGAGRRARAQEQGARGLQLLGVARPAGAAAQHRRVQPGAPRRLRRPARTPGRKTTCAGSARGAAYGRADRRSAAAVAGGARTAAASARRSVGGRAIGRRRLAAGRARSPGGHPDCRRADRRGDPGLLRALLENLLGNAWKFTATKEAARIELAAEGNADTLVYAVRDNGVGFDMAYADQLFAPFQRLHTVAEFPGTGIGLATVQRIVDRHGGRVWAEAEIGKGAAFFWTLSTPSGSKA